MSGACNSVAPTHWHEFDAINKNQKQNSKNKQNKQTEINKQKQTKNKQLNKKQNKTGGGGGSMYTVASTYSYFS